VGVGGGGGVLEGAGVAEGGTGLGVGEGGSGGAVGEDGSRVGVGEGVEPGRVGVALGSGAGGDGVSLGAGLGVGVELSISEGPAPSPPAPAPRIGGRLTTVVLSLAVLLLVSGSALSPTTPAVLVITPSVPESTLTMIWKVRLWPLGSTVDELQVTLCRPPE